MTPARDPPPADQPGTAADAPPGYAAQHPAAAQCRNCGAAVSSRFCPDCGQSTALHPLSVWQFAHELVSHYVAAEGKLWRTLALLALQPGRLTLEYLAGHRQRYIVPLRLYLTASFLFFAAAQASVWLGPDKAPESGLAAGMAKGARQLDHGAVIITVEPDQKDLQALRDEHFEDCLKPDGACAPLRRWLAPAMMRLQQDPRGLIERFSERFRHSLSYAMFLALPLFALLLAGAYRRRGMFYGEHLVFALHIHSFWFLVALVAGLLPDAAATFVPLVFVGYGFWALQRVYGGRWWATLLRGGLVTIGYALIIGLGTAGLALLLLVT